MRVIIDNKDGVLLLKISDYTDYWGNYHKRPTAFIDKNTKKAVKDLIIHALFEKFE